MPEAIFVLYPFSSSKSDIILSQDILFVEWHHPDYNSLVASGAVPMQPAIIECGR